jgi:hypothetical protein
MGAGAGLGTVFTLRFDVTGKTVVAAEAVAIGSSSRYARTEPATCRQSFASSGLRRRPDTRFPRVQALNGSARQQQEGRALR